MSHTFRPWQVATALLLVGAAACSRSDGRDTQRSGAGDTRLATLSSAVPSNTAEPAEAAQPARDSRRAQATTSPPEQVQYVDVSAMGYGFGSDTAPLRIVEFSDFGCGYCRQFHMETFPVLLEEYVETGRVTWKYVPFVLGMFANGEEAAAAGECAGEQGKFVAMRERLFEDQREWKSSAEPDAVFLRFAEEEGLEVDRFKACVEEGWRADKIATASRTAMQLGVRGTPTFFVDGYPISGALPLDVFRDFLTAVLEEKENGGR